MGTNILNIYKRINLRRFYMGFDTVNNNTSNNNNLFSTTGNYDIVQSAETKKAEYQERYEQAKVQEGIYRELLTKSKAKYTSAYKSFVGGKSTPKFFEYKNSFETNTNRLRDAENNVAILNSGLRDSIFFLGKMRTSSI